MILVTGAARSGTSVIASMLQACGGHLGNPDNVNVLYENLAIRENLLKPLLENYGGDRRGQRRFPRIPKPSELSPFDLPHHFHQEFGDHDNPIYKDAKLILLWEVFQRELHNVEWLIVRRPKEQIVDSCMRTHFMNTYTSKEDWERWVDYHEERIEDLKSNCENWEEVWSNEIIEDPTMLMDIVAFYDLEWNEDAVIKCIDPDKYVR